MSSIEMHFLLLLKKIKKYWMTNEWMKPPYCEANKDYLKWKDTSFHGWWSMCFIKSLQVMLNLIWFCQWIAWCRLYRVIFNVKRANKQMNTKQQNNVKLKRVNFIIQLNWVYTYVLNTSALICIFSVNINGMTCLITTAVDKYTELFDCLQSLDIGRDMC